MTEESKKLRELIEEAWDKVEAYYDARQYGYNYFHNSILKVVFTISTEQTTPLLNELINANPDDFNEMQINFSDFLKSHRKKINEHANELYKKTLKSHFDLRKAALNNDEEAEIRAMESLQKLAKNYLIKEDDLLKTCPLQYKLPYIGEITSEFLSLVDKNHALKYAENHTSQMSNTGDDDKAPSTSSDDLIKGYEEILKAVNNRFTDKSEEKLESIEQALSFIKKAEGAGVKISLNKNSIGNFSDAVEQGNLSEAAEFLTYDKTPENIWKVVESLPGYEEIEKGKTAKEKAGDAINGAKEKLGGITHTIRENPGKSGIAALVVAVLGWFGLRKRDEENLDEPDKKKLTFTGKVVVTVGSIAALLGLGVWTKRALENRGATAASQKAPS